MNIINDLQKDIAFTSLSLFFPVRHTNEVCQFVCVLVGARHAKSKGRKLQTPLMLLHYTLNFTICELKKV